MDTAPAPPLADPIGSARAAAPDKTALVHKGIALPYARVQADVARIAGRLLAHGIAPGDVVAVHLRTPVTHWMVTLGLMRIGAVSLSLTRNARAELDALSGVSPENSPENSPRISAVICAAGEEAAFPDTLWRIAVERDWLDGPLPDPGSLPAPEAAARTVGRICFTSGTSGRPKAILLDARLLGARLARTAGRAGIDGETILWCGLGPDTAFGFTATLATWREAGTVLFSTGDLGAFAEMQARGVNLLIASPAALTPLVRDARATERPRLAGPAIVAGGRLTVELRDQIRAHLCDGARIAYGSSEAGGVTLGDAAALDIHPGQVGAAFADLAVEVVGPDGTALPPGREGQLRLRTESTVTGYLNDPEASQAHFADGWFYPGDLAMLSAEGALTLLGRTTQVLNLGGVKLPVEALEARLLALEGVEDVCAYLPAHGRAETPELVIVAVVAEDRAEDLGAAIRTAVPGLPPVALFTARALPRGSMGKVAKPALAEAVTAARAGAGPDDGLGLVSLGVV